MTQATEPTPVSAPHSFIVTTADGYPLVAQHYRATGTLRGYIVIAGAIGVPQHFYRKFAEYTRGRGYDVFTFDYRGIGRSKPKSLRGFEMDFRDWGRRDLAAVVDGAANDAELLDVPVYVVAHSFGGHAFGMLPNHHRVRACFSYGTGAGWHGWMPGLEQIKVLALWNVVGPVLTMWKRYLAWSLLGMGEDLPLGVYRQWRRWCRFPHFCLDDPEVGVQMRRWFGNVRTEMLAAAATDDRWAPPRSRDAILTGYRNANIRKLNYQTSQMNVGALGHMGFFRSRASALWPAAIDWLASV